MDPFFRKLGVVLAIVALSRILLAQWVASPYVFMDELIYSKLAWGFGHGHPMHFRGFPSAVPGGLPEGGLQSPVNFPSILYPLLLAPTTWIADTYAAFRAAQVLNQVLVVSAGIPIFLAARLALPATASLLVATISVLLPSTYLANVYMSESLFFPLVMWVVYLSARSAQSADPGPKVGLGVVLGLAFFAKPHGMVIPPLVVLATFLGSEWARRDEGGFGRRLLSYWPVVGLFALAVVAHLVRVNTSLGSPNLLDVSKALGTYGSVVGPQKPLNWLQAAACLGGNLGALALAVGFAPVALFVAWAWSVFRAGNPDERRLVWSTVFLAAALLALTVRTTVLLDVPDRVHERYTFYVEPLILIGAMAWLERAVRREPKTGQGWTTALALGLVVVAAWFVPAVLAGTPVSDTATYTAFLPFAKYLGPNWAVGAVVVAGLGVVWLWNRALAAGSVKLGQRLLGGWVIALFLLATATQGGQSTKRFLPDVFWLNAQVGPDERLALAGERDLFVPFMLFDLFRPGYLRKFYYSEPFDGWGDEPAGQAPSGEYVGLSGLGDGTRLLSPASRSLALPVLARRGDFVLYEKHGRVFASN